MRSKIENKIVFLLLLLTIFSQGCGEDEDKKFLRSHPSASYYSNFDLARNKLGPGLYPRHWARLFALDPETDQNQRQEVQISNLSETGGKLVGEFIEAKNCLNSEDSPCLLKMICLCKEENTVESVGLNYLHVEPPEKFSQPGDQFSELMLYYHVNQMYKFFKEEFGYTGHEKRKVVATANMQFKLREVWTPFDNAMYLPKESSQSLPPLFRREFDSLMFGQGKLVDYSYDASVIYHEYTHFIVGIKRLNGYGVDQYGLDNSPISINEGYADYFPASFRKDPVIGNYALNKMRPGETYARNLEEFFRCQDWQSEVHANGRLWSSALWAIEKKIGPKKARRIAFEALLGMKQDTSIPQAVQMLVDEAEKLTPPVDEEVKKILNDRGLLDCKRIKPLLLEKFDSQKKIVQVEGTSSIGSPHFSNYVPGYIQYKVDIKEGTKALLITSEALKLDAVFGGIMGSSPSPSDIGIALKKDDPITYDYNATPAQSSADLIISNAKKVKVFGPCLQPGTHYLQLLNYQTNQVIVTSLNVKQLQEVPLGLSNYNNCVLTFK